MSLLGLPMYKLNLWCMIVPPLGSHGRPGGFAPWPPMTACRRHNSTPQVQFTHTRPCKDMQNMLYYICSAYSYIPYIWLTFCLLVYKVRINCQRALQAEISVCNFLVVSVCFSAFASVYVYYCLFNILAFILFISRVYVQWSEVDL